MNSDNNLVTMANQIGMFFETMPDRSQALEDFAKHLKSYWEPRMLKTLLQHIDTTGGNDMLPMALESIRLHKSLLQ